MLFTAVNERMLKYKLEYAGIHVTHGAIKSQSAQHVTESWSPGKYVMKIHERYYVYDSNTLNINNRQKR